MQKTKCFYLIVDRVKKVTNFNIQQTAHKMEFHKDYKVNKKI